MLMLPVHFQMQVLMHLQVVLICFTGSFVCGNCFFFRLLDSLGLSSFNVFYMIFVCDVPLLIILSVLILDLLIV